MSSSNKIVQKPTTTVDHNFFIPPSVVDIRHTNDDDLIGMQDENSAGSTNQDAPVDITFEIIPGEEIYEDASAPGEAGDTGSLLPVPTGMEIVEQIYSVAENGTASVDVIIDVPNMPGVTQIDVRITKA